MAFVVQLEPELQQQLNQLAQRRLRSRSPFVREAIAQVVHRFGQDDEARRQSAIATHAQGKEWSEPCQDRSNWKA